MSAPDLGACAACGKPVGTGTLLDFAPQPPIVARERGMDQMMWASFAERYGCPICDVRRREHDV